MLQLLNAVSIFITSLLLDFIVFLHVEMIIKLSWDNQEQLFVVDATDLLRTFMSECRRLIKISNASSTVDYHWLKFYDSKLVRHKNGSHVLIYLNCFRPLMFQNSSLVI